MQGYAVSVSGPALPSLRNRVGANTAEFGVVFTLNSLGGLVGGLPVGVLGDMLEGHFELVISVCWFMVGVMGFVTPAAASLEIMGLVFFLQGMALIGGVLNGNYFLF